MNLKYYLVDPTKNITALAVSPVPPKDYAETAARIMKEEPACEQVGFLTCGPEDEWALDMAGGEFCGNASLSAAALIGSFGSLPPGQTKEILLRVSGAPEKVRVKLTAGAADYTGEVTMPPPLNIAEERLPLGTETLPLPVVYFPGIAHIIAPADLADDKTAEEAVRRWCGQLGTAGLGLMLYSPEQESLRPLVYIPGADTLFWESSCASGATAVGAYTLWKTGKPAVLSLRQPGGTLRIEATQTALRLTGRAKILGCRTLR